MSERPTARVHSMLAAPRKSPAEMMATIGLFGNGEWPEIGGAMTKRRERVFPAVAIQIYTGLSPVQFAQATHTVLHRLGATQDDARVTILEGDKVQVWMRPAFFNRILPDAMALYVSACDQRDSQVARH